MARKNKIHLFARKKKTKIKCLNQKLEALSPNTQKTVQNELSHISLSFTPIKNIQSTRSGRKKLINNQKQTYIECLSTKNFSLFHEQTPATPQDNLTPNRLQINPEFDRHIAQDINRRLDFEDCLFETFSFDVNIDTLKPRGQRNKSQNQTMEGITAQKFLTAFGLQVMDETKKKVEFHWAHRQAWSLYGEQNKSNLDATTAGSNYDTLFKVESPIKMLIKEQITSLVHVEGVVKFINPNQHVAESITYRFTWNETKECTVIIDPLNVRYPTRDEADAIECIIRLESKRH